MTAMVGDSPRAWMHLSSLSPPLGSCSKHWAPACADGFLVQQVQLVRSTYGREGDQPRLDPAESTAAGFISPAAKSLNGSLSTSWRSCFCLQRNLHQTMAAPVAITAAVPTRICTVKSSLGGFLAVSAPQP